MTVEKKPPETVSISHIALRELTADILEKVGMPEDDAALTAEALVDADLRGISTHGTKMLPLYVKKFKLGLFNPRPEMREVRATGTIHVWDSDYGLGHPAAIKATLKALELARTYGLASLAVHRTNHTGCMAYYPLLAADEGYICFITTIAAQNMAPWGGTEPILGNNPFAIAFPTPGDFHIVLDMATSTVSKGRVRQVAERGEKIPEGWAVTANGRPVTDPSKFVEQGAGQFFLAPIGGPKGSGISIVNAILAGVLAGTDNLGLLLPSLTKTFDRVVDTGLFILVIDPRSFCEWETYSERMDQFVRTIKGSQPVTDQPEVYLPGELEHRTKQERLKEGVPIAAELFETLKALASGENNGRQA